MKKTGRVLAFVLAVIMAFSVSLTALAEGADANFTLSVSNPNLYAGMSYEVTATITDIPASEVDSYTKFTWNITETENGASITGSGVFNKEKNDGSNTYTVSETANFIMPTAGKQPTIYATLGSRSKNIKVTSLQPIESFDVQFTNTEYAYYDNASTVYLDRKSDATSEKEYLDFEITNISPATNDDSITPTLGGADGYFTLLKTGSNKYRLTFKDNFNPADVSLTLAPQSGKKTSVKTFTVKNCVPLSSYGLKITTDGVTSKEPFVKTESSTELPPVTLSAIAGKSFSLTPSNKSPGASNDVITYELYTDEACTTKAASKYCTVKNSVADISIDVAAPYWLVVKNCSPDPSGKLLRTLAQIKINLQVYDSNPITAIDVYNLDNAGDIIPDSKLSEITLYTNGSEGISTFTLNNRVVTTPLIHSDQVLYSVQDKSIATIDANGLITAKKSGTTMVMIQSRDNSSAFATLTVNVKKGVSSLTPPRISDGSIAIPSGHSAQLITTADPTDHEETIVWSSANEDVLSIDRYTGVATAKAGLTSDEEVMIYARSNITERSNSFAIKVIPAVRAQKVTLNVESGCSSDTFEQEDGITYTDYQTPDNDKNKKSFSITANATASSDKAPNDELLWTVSYNNGPALSFDEAVSKGYIKYEKNTNLTYNITPLKTEAYTITCKATLNSLNPQPSDASDTVVLKLKPYATNISVHNDTDNIDAKTTLNLPVGKSIKFTVKTSDDDNNKTVDPPTYSLPVGGDEYISVTSAVSKDNEGITYTVKGLKRTSTAQKLTFASKSGRESFNITVNVRNDLSDAAVTGFNSSYTYTGSKITFKASDLTLKVNGSELDKSKYSSSLQFENNLNVGTAKVTITGADTYAGSAKVITFKIVPQTVKDAVFGNIGDQRLTTDSRAATPVTSVRVNGRTLKKDTDYTVTYKNNKAAGKATFVITGMGNYTGTASTTFNVLDTAVNFNIGGIAARTHSYSPITPSPTVKYNGTVLKKDVDYKLSYGNNTNIGIANITITGIGKFYGTTKTTFKIKPKKASLKSVSKKKKAFKVKWKAVDQATGYQIQYSTSSKFAKNNKKVTVNNANARSKTIKKLKKKKKYYVRVRAFKTVNGTKIYGSWSKKKSVKTK